MKPRWNNTLESGRKKKDSEAVKSGSVTAFTTGDEDFTLAEGAEPAVKGSLKTACSASDAIVLQYYEECDPVKAAFGYEADDFLKLFNDAMDSYDSLYREYIEKAS